MFHNVDHNSITGSIMGFMSVMMIDVANWYNVIDISSDHLPWYLKLGADVLRAIIFPFVGASIGFFTPKVWKWIDSLGKKKKKKTDDEKSSK